LPGIEPGSPA